jgi:hypothetical protein
LQQRQHRDVHLGSNILTVACMKMAVFWVVVLCSLVQRYLLPPSLGWLITPMMNTANTSEMLVNFYLTTWCYNPDDSHTHEICTCEGACKKFISVEFLVDLGLMCDTLWELTKPSLDLQEGHSMLNQHTLGAKLSCPSLPVTHFLAFCVCQGSDSYKILLSCVH